MVSVRKTNRLVCIYVRKSRLKTDDAMEIDRQLELLIDYAEANNMEYVIFTEEGSSEDWDRPELQKMLKELKRNIYDGVLVTDQDRLTRDRTDFGIFVRFAKAEGLMLFTLNKTYNFMNDDDVFTSGIQSEMDNHFMRMTKRKLKRGRIQAISKGVYFGIAPYGYTKDENTKHLVPHPEESIAVKEMFDLYVNKQLNQVEIVEQLTMRGMVARSGKEFSVRAISLILSNVAYIGVVHYELQGETPIHVEDAHPALVDKDTFNKAQLIRAERRQVPQKSQRGVYALSKLIVCAKCKQTLSFCMKYGSKILKAQIGKDSRKLYMLNCHASKGQRAKKESAHLPRCTNLGINVERLLEALMTKLREHIKDLDAEIEKLKAGDNTLVEKVTQKQHELTVTFNKLEQQKTRIQDGYKIGIYDADEAQSEVQAIKEQQLAIEQELKNLDGASAKSEIERKQKQKETIIKILSMDIEDNQVRVNKMLHSIIDRIEYYKEVDDNHRLSPFVFRVIYKKKVTDE